MEILGLELLNVDLSVFYMPTVIQDLSLSPKLSELFEK